MSNSHSSTVYSAFDFIKNFKSASNLKCSNISLNSTNSFNNFIFCYDGLFFQIHCYAYSERNLTFCIKYFYSKNSNLNITLYQTSDYANFILFIDMLLNNIIDNENIKYSEIIGLPELILGKKTKFKLIIFHEVPFYFEEALDSDYVDYGYSRIFSIIT